MKSLIFALLFLLPLPASATVYEVGPSQTFTTIAACAAIASAGDTCNVHGGAYAGWSQSTSGNSGSPITFQANGTLLTTCFSSGGPGSGNTSCAGPNGDAVTITSAIDVSNVSYITVAGFTTTATTAANQNTNHIVFTHNASNGDFSIFKILDGIGSTGADNLFSYNHVQGYGVSTRRPAFYVYGDRNRFEHNEMNGGGGDCFDVGGANLVFRNNYCHDNNGASGEHLDFVQVIGAGTTPTLSFSLLEGNVIQNCVNDGGNCHAFAIIRTGPGPVADTNITRFNYAQNIDGDCINFGGLGDDVPNNSAYNNTCASEHLATYNASFGSVQGTTPNTTILNNIAYNVEASGQYPFSGNTMNGNLAYSSAFTGSWSSPYSLETTYSPLHNANPLFANYPADGTLQAGSPAIGAGVALTTTTGSGSNSTSLTLNNAHLFQPGWAGVNGDCIRVGASTTTCIAAIDYNSNTLTVSPAISWSSGAAVYLYQNSSGTTVLGAGSPDVGAFPYQGTLISLAPPTNLSAISK